MAVNTTEIATVFSSMMTAVETELDALYTADKVDAEIYAKVIASMMQSTLQLAATTVQQQPVVDSQVAKTAADTSFVGTQETELSNSVTYNNKIKALDSYSDMIGTMGAGSLVISTDMWTKYFGMIDGLNADGTTPASTTVTKL